MADPMLLTRVIIGFIGVSLLACIGILLTYRYRKYKYRPLLYWGISWFCLAILFSYAPLASTVILAGQVPLNASDVALFYNAGTGALVMWIMAWGEILYRKQIKRILLILSVFTLFLTLSFFYFYATQPEMLMTFQTPNLYVPGLWIKFNGLIMICAFLGTGILFWFKGRQVEDKKIRNKRFLFLLQSILTTLGCLAAAISGNIVFELLSYIFMIIVGILFNLMIGIDFMKQGSE